MAHCARLCTRRMPMAMRSRVRGSQTQYEAGGSWVGSELGSGLGGCGLGLGFGVGVRA